jgi:hypothetical protein
MKTGDKVKFISATDDQINWGGNDDPRLILDTNTTYEVEKVEVHSWHTKVYLKGIKGEFNSVHFKVISDEPQTELITYLNKEGFIYTIDDLRQAFFDGRLFEAGELEIDCVGYLTVFDAWFKKTYKNGI